MNNIVCIQGQCSSHVQTGLGYSFINIQPWHKVHTYYNKYYIII